MWTLSVKMTRSSYTQQKDNARGSSTKIVPKQSRNVLPSIPTGKRGKVGCLPTNVLTPCSDYSQLSVNYSHWSHPNLKIVLSFFSF